MVAVPPDTRPRTHGGLRSAAEVQAVASSFALFERPYDASHGAGGKFAFVSVGPGAFRLGERQVDTFSPLFGVTRSQWVADNDGMTDSAGDVREAAATRGKITGWTQKSRNRMRLTLGMLDYTPMFRPGRLLPKMVTLTLPARWESVAPSSKVLKRKLVDKSLKATFRRHWGYELVGVWKLEFQRRGAPHLHILMAPPSGLCPQTGETFEQWLRSIWSKACSDADSTLAEIQDHRAKGVHIDDRYGLTGTDSKRIADYFVKHGLFAAKEYQNQVPELWRDEGPGRFWGYWGLSVANGEQSLGQVVQRGRRSSSPGWSADARHYVNPDGFGLEVGDLEDEPLTLTGVAAKDAMARVARRWAKANGKHRKLRVTIPDDRRAAALVAEFGPDRVERVAGKLVDTTTGEVLERRSSRWHGPFVRRSSGFLSVNDGAEFAAQLFAAVAGEPYRPAPESVDGRHPARLVDDVVEAKLAERRRLLDEYYEAVGYGKPA